MGAIHQLAVGVKMATAVGATPRFNGYSISAHGTNSGTESVSHTIPALLTNGYILAVIRQNAYVAATGVTFDGVAMTQLAVSGGIAAATHQTWGLAVGSKPAGTYTCLATLTNGSTTNQLALLEFEFVHQTVSSALGPAPGGWTNSHSVSIPTAIDDYALMLFGHQGNTLASQTPGTTEIANMDGNVNIIGRTAVSTTTVIAATITAATNTTIVTMALKKV